MDKDTATTTVLEEDKFRHDNDSIDEARRDANEIIENDGRSPTKTFFYHNDMPTGNEHSVRKFGEKYENKWEWLNELHEEHYSIQHNSSRETAVNKRDLRTWMNQLHCTDMQIEWACQIYDSTSQNPNDEGYVGGYKNEGVLLGIVTLVVNSDVNRKIRDEDQFHEIRRSCNVSNNTILAIRKKVRPLL